MCCYVKEILLTRNAKMANIILLPVDINIGYILNSQHRTAYFTILLTQYEINVLYFPAPLLPLWQHRNIGI